MRLAADGARGYEAKRAQSVVTACRREFLLAVSFSYRTPSDDRRERFSWSARARSMRNEVEAAYRRGDLLDKRRQLLRAWEGYVAQLSSSKAEIVPLRAS